MLPSVLGAARPPNAKTFLITVCVMPLGFTSAASQQFELDAL